MGCGPLEIGLGGCGALAWLPCGMWSLPELEIGPVSPAFAGTFLTTGP